MTTAEKVIEVENLVTHYGPRLILDDVSLNVREGEIRIIMGGSGSGKSTLLRYLLGLNRPTSGSIRLLGTDLTKAKPHEFDEIRKHLGVSFQGGALFTSMTVQENVMLPLREHTKLDESTMAIMARMKLEVVNLGGSVGRPHFNPTRRDANVHCGWHARTGQCVHDRGYHHRVRQGENFDYGHC